MELSINGVGVIDIFTMSDKYININIGTVKNTLS